MDITRFRKMLAEFILTAALITGVAIVMGPVLPEPVFAEPLGISPHITSTQYYGGGGICPDPYGYFYPC